jgi:hypothetical protein
LIFSTCAFFWFILESVLIHELWSGYGNSKCRELLIHHLCLWEMHGQNHILGNMQPSLLLGFVLPSSGLVQVCVPTSLFTCFILPISSSWLSVALFNLIGNCLRFLLHG